MEIKLNEKYDKKTIEDKLAYEGSFGNSFFFRDEENKKNIIFDFLNGQYIAKWVYDDGNDIEIIN